MDTAQETLNKYKSEIKMIRRDETLHGKTEWRKKLTRLTEKISILGSEIKKYASKKKEKKCVYCQK